MKIEQVKVGDLNPYENNARTHPESQIKQIARSIEEFGFNNPILATREGRIIAGHGRVEAAKVLNLDTVPVVRIEHLSPEQIQAYTLADNQLALTSKWDADALAEEIKELYCVGFDLDLLGFDPSELAAMLEVKPDIDENLLDEVEPESKYKTNQGDLWMLGDHELLVGEELNEAEYLISTWVKLTGKQPKLLNENTKRTNK
jgi:ParB-like chromosome segregation protein Spo0J